MQENSIHVVKKRTDLIRMGIGIGIGIKFMCPLLHLYKNLKVVKRKHFRKKEIKKWESDMAYLRKGD